MHNRRPKNSPNLLIMRILVPNPCRMVGLYFMPNPISQIRVELAIRMEPITSFDQFFWITAFGYFTLEDLPGWELVVDHVEVFEFCAVVDYLLVHF